MCVWLEKKAGENTTNVGRIHLLRLAPFPSLPPIIQHTMAANAKTLAAIDAKYGDRLASMTETEKANLGLPYLANEPAMVRARLKARRLMVRYNQSMPSTYDPPDLKEGEQPKGVGASDNDADAPAPGVASQERREILADLFGMDLARMGEVELEVSSQGGEKERDKTQP